MASKKRPLKSSSIPVSGVRGRETMPPERVSQTTISLVDEPSSPHPAPHDDALPSAWIDKLLVTTIELPIASGEDAVVRSVVDTLASVLTAHAVGACFIASDGQRVYRRLPLHDESRDAGVDPTRLFPSFARERILEIGSGASGSTLHLATDDPAQDHDRAPAVHLARRASHVLARGIDLAREHAETARVKKEVFALESRAIQADKLASFGQMAAGLVHELNNPLTSIVAYSDYLIRAAVASPGANTDDVERLRRISESANRMLRFTRDLVSYARPSSELAVPVVLHAVLDQAVAFCEHVASAAGAVIEKRYASDVRGLRGMPEQLTQVFVNLVTNACQAMPKGGGRITIATASLEHGRRVRVVIEDTGVGITPAELPQIFAPFFTTKREHGGTGLGLSIVKSIVDRHDGTIRVDSKTPGGTRFVVELPVGVR